MKMYSGKITSLVLLIGATFGATSAFAGSTWVSENGNTELQISGNSWFSTEGGAATVRRGTGSADFEVYYRDGNGSRCAYRKRVIESGAAVILESADSTQSSDLCPSGKMYRSGYMRPTVVYAPQYLVLPDSNIPKQRHPAKSYR